MLTIVSTVVVPAREMTSKVQTGETPLHLAARRGCLDVMEHLLENGADVNAENQVLDLLRRAYCYL
jgi:ankyrin repeat protein